MLGLGLALFFLTFAEFGRGTPPSGVAWLGLAVPTLGTALYAIGTRRTRVAQRANNIFFAYERGTEVLRRRRLVEGKIRTIRRATTAVLFVVTLWTFILLGTLRCNDDLVCTGIVPQQEAWLNALRPTVVILGATVIAIISLIRILSLESDRLEFLAGEAERHRDDGPIPGLKRSRWE